MEIEQNEINEKRDEAVREVKLYLLNDWDLKEETPEYFLLRRNRASAFGHFLIFIFFWWTLGIANVLYWLALRQTKKIIK